MDKYVGKRLDGRYEIKEVIGVGGMAYVYKAYDSIDDRTVAVKILRDEYLANEEFTRRFKNESKAIAILSHPNIVKVYDVSFGERLQYIVMEYIDGISIRDTKTLLDHGYVLEEIGDKMLENYAKQVLEDGYFHADPHPGNIVIDEGQIVYLDLGLMGRLSTRDRIGFENAVEAVGMRSSSKLMEALMSFSVARDLTAIDQPHLLAELDVILERYGSVEVENIDIGQFLNDILNVTRQTNVTLPSSVTMVSRGLVTMEGTLLEYVGSFNMVDIINKHIVRTKESSDDLKDVVKDLVVALNGASRGALRAAEYLGDTMQLLSRGQLKVNMEMLGSAEPMMKISRILNRMTIGLIVAGLLISAALLTFAIDEAHIFGMPILAFIEFVVAIILSLWIAIDVYRRSKKL